MAIMRKPSRPLKNDRALKTPPTATMLAGYAVCRFANGDCRCLVQRHYPCDSVLGTAKIIIEAAKADLRETYVLTPKSSKRKV